MQKQKFTGTGPAVITPFKKDLRVDYDALDRILEFQIENGINFIVALGTTAETVTLTEEERHKIYQFIKEKNNKRLPLMVGFGGNNTAEVIAHIKSADFNGIDAILSVVPYYNKPSQEGLYQHFMSIAEVCPVPIMLYNVPSRTGTNMSAETTVRLAKSSDKFFGIKEASGDMDQIKAILKNSPDGFRVLSGDDASIQPICEAGGHGVVSVMANAFPARTVELTKMSIENHPDAKSKQASYQELINLLFVDGNPAGVKAVLNERGFCENVLRLPLTVASRETCDKIESLLKEMKI